VADELAREEVTLKTVLLYFYYQTPQFVFYVAPVAVLVATLVTVAVMTKNSELIVMRACGISLYRAVAPLVLFGLLVSGLLFIAQERVLPSANTEADRLNRIVRGFGPAVSPFNQRWMAGRNGLIYRYDEFNSSLKRFRNLSIYDVSVTGQRLDSATYAASASFAGPSSDPLFGVWQGMNGWNRHFAEPAHADGPLNVTYEAFTARAITMEAPEYFASRPVETEQMSYDQMLTFNQLRAYIDQLSASGANVVRFTVALHRKIAFPLVTVIMTLLAIPFAASGGRRGALYGIGVGIVLALSYMVTMSVFGALGTGGVLPPALAAWAPNLLFGAAAAYMILTVRT
jgi:LPS export ABC transporter permease LptG